MSESFATAAVAAAGFPTTATHWGTYRGEVRGGRLVALHPYEGDPDPSPIARNIPASHRILLRPH